MAAQHRHALGYGSAAAALYGIVAGSLREPSPLYGLPFGAAVWAVGYAVLPEAGIYKPIWEYDARTLGEDLSAHLVFGVTTSVTYAALTRRGS